MEREKELINRIKDYLDSGLWEFEVCDLSKEDLELIVYSLEWCELLGRVTKDDTRRNN